MIEERLVNIETKITFQEDLVEELNKRIYQQQIMLERLEAMCKSLSRQLTTQAESGRDSLIANEMPPHY